MGSLKLCQNLRKTEYIIRCGLIYQCLGNLYGESHKKCKSSRRKSLLNLCQLYYEKSANTFNTIDTAIPDYLELLIDRLEFQNVLYEGIIII